MTAPSTQPIDHATSKILFRGSDLTFVTPEGWTLADIASKLKEGRAVDVCFEPGDLTRYRFAIMLIGSHDLQLMIVRLSAWGSQVRAFGALSPHLALFESRAALDEIALHDGYCKELFALLFERLWEHIEAVR